MWKKAGVKAILGFNEPDNHGESDLTPEQASIYWFQLHDFANTFDPPLTLVGPGMTHWTADGGSPWLDQFFGNLTDAHIRGIKFLAQHDYSGDAKGIIAKADATYKRYNKKVQICRSSGIDDNSHRESCDKSVRNGDRIDVTQPVLPFMKPSKPQKYVVPPLIFHPPNSNFGVENVCHRHPLKKNKIRIVFMKN